MPDGVRDDRIAAGRLVDVLAAGALARNVSSRVIRVDLDFNRVGNFR